MEVLERSLKEERCLWLRMKEKEENFCGYTHLEVAHGHASWEHGPCQGSGHSGFKNFHFSRIVLGQLPTK